MMEAMDYLAIAIIGSIAVGAMCAAALAVAASAAKLQEIAREAKWLK